MNFTERLSELASRRVRPVERPNDPPPATAFGGWGHAPSDDLLPVDPATAERNARAAGAAVLAEFNAQRQADARAQMDAQLANVRRGHDYGRPKAS